MSLKLVKLRASRNWYIRGSVRGVAVFETTKTQDRDAADAIRIRRETEVLNATIHGTRATKSFTEAAVSYMEAPGKSVHERRFVFPLVDALGRLPVGKITQAVLDEHIRKHFAGRTPATILRNVVTPVTAILNHAARRGWCEAPKFERPKQPRGRRRFATYEEAGRLVSAAAPHLRPLVVFLLYTGARMSEALELDWRDVGDGWVTFRDTKNGEDRGVPLHPVVVRFLGERGPGRVFLNQRGKPYADRGRRVGGQIKTGWRGMCRRAGVDGMVPHDLRHTCSTWLTMAGVHEQVRDEVLGHSSTDMGRRYSHVVRQALVEAVNRLPDLVETREESVKLSDAKPVFVFTPKA